MKLARPPAPAKKVKAEKRGQGRNSPQTPLPPSPKNKIGVTQRFRRLALSQTSKQNNFQFLFEKNFGARHQKNVEKIFLFWTQTSLKFAGEKRGGG